MDIPVYLINLDRSKDRLETISKHLNDIGIDFIRTSGVDGLTLPDDYPLANKERFLINQKKPIVMGEVGCAESHRNIWKEIIKKDIPYTLILEDDVVISDSIHDLLETEIYKKFDFLNFSGAKPYQLDPAALSMLRKQQIVKRPSLLSSKRKIWKRLEWRRQWRIFHLHYYNETNQVICECDPAPALAGGYIISNKAAKHFLETSNDLFFPIDLVWRHSGGQLRQAFLFPSIVEQSENITNIPGRIYTGYKLSPIQKIKRFFKKSRRYKRRIDVFKLYGRKIF